MVSFNPCRSHREGQKRDRANRYKSGPESRGQGPGAWPHCVVIKFPAVTGENQWLKIRKLGKGEKVRKSLGTRKTGQNDGFALQNSYELNINFFFLVRIKGSIFVKEHSSSYFSLK